LRWRFAEKTVHEWATNKRMMVLFVHSCNIRGRYAITHKAYDDVISTSNAVFRRYSRISPWQKMGGRVPYEETAPAENQRQGKGGLRQEKV
jgi:hypothetical protein